MSTDVRSSYKKLITKNKHLIVLSSAEGILHWDMETMMPPKGVGLRSEQLALLSSIHHRMSTAPVIGELLKVVLKHPDYETLSEVEKRNVQLIKKNYDEQTKLPTKLVAEIAKQQAIAVNTWKKAKATQNFNLFKPELEKLVALNKQAAAILMEAKQTKTPYDALLDIYEPKMVAEDIAKIFNSLQSGLEKLLRKIEAATQPDTRILSRKVPLEKQRVIANLLAETLGYDVSSPNAGGRIDETEHPFSTGYYDDVRITTHYHVDKWTSSVFSVLHEAGHALYEQGLPQEWKYQPVGAPCSLGFHESQSRLYENIIGRSKEFWVSVMPKIEDTQVELDEFIRAINVVAPSKIRIEADEVTYNLHVIIRFQIEKELFADKLTVAELPTVWNQKYEQTLGVKIENDSEGVMQDTHWASGLYGYFPTYALGNIYSGQIINKIQQENPLWREELAKGNLESVRAWLTRNIYNHGNLYDPAELLEKATGKKPTVEPYLQYLEEKYRKLYAL
ncbi:MAG: carboxypeptidase M32 [Candidatus Bathyarchaeia archaeon]|jgi:carboxypeptidase Taq